MYKTGLLIIVGITMFFNNAMSQFYDFPFVGWQQTYTSYAWTGAQNETGIYTLNFHEETTIDGQTYISNGSEFFRSEAGKIYQYKYDWETDSYLETLAYDFTLNLGDALISDNFTVEDSAHVVLKERIANLVGDSVWQIKIEYNLNWITKDTITWEEGVGNKNLGLIKTNFPDGGFVHGCTLLEDNRKISINEKNLDYCNCQYVYGIDDDNDGFGNYEPRMANIDLGFHFDNPSVTKYYKARHCDTLAISTDDLESFIIYSQADCNGTLIEVDSFIAPNTFIIFDVSEYNAIYLSVQCTWDFAEIILTNCFETDCDDNDPAINPNAEEIPNNDVDEDCDGLIQTTSNKDFDIIDIQVYPNPTANEIYIDGHEHLDIKVEIMDIHGQIIQASNNPKVINLANYSNGMYFVCIHNNETGNAIIEKIYVMK